MQVWLSTIANMFKPDERFLMHRYSSTRLAMFVGIVLMLAWFNYELIVNDVIRVDLAVIAGAIAVTKVSAMLYLRWTH